MPTTPRGYAYPSGSDPTDVPGDLQALAEDVDDDVTAVAAAALLKAGGTMTGDLVLAGDANAALEPTTKQQMDAAIAALSATYLPLAGGTLTGDLVLAADANAAMEATTKQQLDAAIAGIAAGGLTKIAGVSTSGQSSVTFSSIPNTYRHLLLVAHVAGGSAALNMRFNGDTGGNYGRAYDGGASVTAATGQTTIELLDFMHDPSFLQAWIPGYADGFAKGGFFEAFRRSAGTTQSSHRKGEFIWDSVAAISSIEVYRSSGNFTDGSLISLYGLEA